MKYTRRKPYVKFVNRLPEEDIVQNGLAVTPSQMLDLTNRGVPITPANLGLQYIDGVSQSDFSVGMEYQRGVDIGDMWEHRQDMRKKMRSPEFIKHLQETE